MEATISVNNWSILGLKLGVPQYEINNIKQQYHSVPDQLQGVLSHWIGTGDASWAVLVEALCSPLVNMKGLARQIASNHPWQSSHSYSMTDELDYTPRVSLSTLSQPTLQHPSAGIYRTHIVSDPHKIGLYKNYQKVHYQPPHKKLKTEEQISIPSSTLSNISALPQHQSGNTIPDSIPGYTMNPHQLTDNVDVCSSSIKFTNVQLTLPLSSTDVYRTHIVSDPHEIRLYRNYQKACYQRTEFPTYFKQPTPSIRKFINLELVNKKRESKEERFEGMTDKLHGNITIYVQQRGPLGIEQIAEVKECEKLPRSILIEGDPGVGKTTLVWELCKGWGENRLLHKWDVVVLVQIRDIDAREASNLEQLLDPYEQFRSELDYIKRTNGNGVMIIFDGYDELSQKQKQRTSVFQGLLVGKLLPGSTLLVTSRPIATRELPMEFREQLHEHIEVVGFRDNDIYAYIECKFCDNSDMLKDFQSYISSHPFIYKAMYIPLHCALVTDLYKTYWRKGKKEFAPKTITQLYTYFLHSLLERYLDDHPVYGPQELGIQELTDLPQVVYDDLMTLAELAANGIVLQQYVFDNLTHNTLGLMQRVIDTESRKSKSVSCCFLHLTLQEYLASLYWSKLNFENASHLFTERGVVPVEKYIFGTFWADAEYNHDNSNIHWPALHFYAGLTGLVGTPLEPFIVDVESNSVNHNVLYLLFESQNPEFISTVLKESQYYVYIRTKLQGYITGYCISHCSSTAKWEINDENNESLVTSTSSSMGGMISSLIISNVTNYSTSFQMLFKLERYTKELFHLSLSNSSDNYKLTDLSLNISSSICCDELSQLHRYCPKLQTFTISVNSLKLNCTLFFSSLHLLSCLETLDFKGIIIDDSRYIVSNGLRQTTTLKLLSLSDCDLMNLSPEGLSQNKSIVSLKLDNIKMYIRGSKALKQIMIENMNLTNLKLSGSFHCFNCPSNKEHSISLMTKEFFEGVQQSKSVKQLSLDDFQLIGIEKISTNSTLTSLVLKDLDMEMEEAMALKQVLIENTTLRKLTLSNCISSIDVAEVIGKGLHYNTGVMKLDVNEVVVVGALIQELANNSTLLSLNLSSFDMDKKGAMGLKQVLIKNTTLRKMTLSNCIKSRDVAEVVAEGLEYNTGVTKLSLKFLKGGVFGTLMQGLRNSSTLTSLTLSFCNADEKGAKALKEVLIENTTLRKLTLSNYCIRSTDTAEIVAEGLEYNTGVMELVLFDIDEGVILGTLIQGLRRNSTLSSLVLRNVNLDMENVVALKQVLIDTTTLREMTISNCIKSMDVAEVVAEGLQFNTEVMKLTLAYQEEDGVIRTLTEKLSHSSSLKSLILCDNHISIEDFRLFGDLLKLNQTLKYLTIIENVNLEKAKFLAGSLCNCNLEEIQVFDERGIMGQECAKVLVDAVLKNSVTKLILPDMYQQDLSVYSYPIDRVMYKNVNEFKL